MFIVLLAKRWPRKNRSKADKRQNQNVAWTAGGRLINPALTHGPVCLFSLSVWRLRATWAHAVSESRELGRTACVSSRGRAGAKWSYKSSWKLEPRSVQSRFRIRTATPSNGWLFFLCFFRLVNNRFLRTQEWRWDDERRLCARNWRIALVCVRLSVYV